MKKSSQCPKCGSTEVVADAKVIDRGQSNIPMEMCIATFTKPEALLFKGKQESKVSAWVCTACLPAPHPGPISFPHLGSGDVIPGYIPSSLRDAVPKPEACRNVAGGNAPRSPAQ